MTKTKPHEAARPSLISVRVNAEERARLVCAAGDISLSAYVRKQLFGAERTSELATCLHSLGASGIGNALARLAAVSESNGFDRETQAELQGALREFRALRRDLLRGLGLRPKGDA